MVAASRNDDAGHSGLSWLTSSVACVICVIIRTRQDQLELAVDLSLESFILVKLSDHTHAN